MMPKTALMWKEIPIKANMWLRGYIVNWALSTGRWMDLLVTGVAGCGQCYVQVVGLLQKSCSVLSLEIQEERRNFDEQNSRNWSENNLYNQQDFVFHVLSECSSLTKSSMRFTLLTNIITAFQTFMLHSPFLFPANVLLYWMFLLIFIFSITFIFMV